LARRFWRRCAIAGQQANVLLFHPGDVNIFDDILRQRAGFAGGVDIDGRDTTFG
jgi:hypothetical protein